MIGTISGIYIQLIFAVKEKRSLITSSFEEEFFKHISGIIKQKDQKLLAIKAIPDHIHILIGIRPSCCLSDLVREVKISSNKFINERKLSPNKFEWQDGYGAFSSSHPSLKSVITYIKDQKVHHRKQSFRKEYIALLTKFQIEFKEEYLLEWIKDLE